MVYLGVLKISRNIKDCLHGKVCLRETLYTEKNQDNYIGRNSNILSFRCLAGEVSLECLKGSSLGTLVLRNIKDCLDGKGCLRENLYTGKNQDYNIRKNSTILSIRCLAGEVAPECLKGSSLGTLPGVIGAWYI